MCVFEIQGMQMIMLGCCLQCMNCKNEWGVNLNFPV